MSLFYGIIEIKATFDRVPKMTMTMVKNKLFGFIDFLKENSKDGEIRLYPSTLSTLELDEMGADKILDELGKTKAIFNKRISFAPNKIQSTNPKQASFSSTQNNIYTIPVFFFNVDEGQLQEYIGKNFSSKFSDKTAIIQIGKEKIKLPLTKNEHCFCRVAFKYPIEELVDWSEIYLEMTGDEIDNLSQKDLWRVVYDAMESINKKVGKKLSMKLFEWNATAARRLF